MIFIRVDMNEQIATGHLMRCLSVANAARRMGEETTFIVADNMAVQLLTRYRYRYIVLDTDWNDMDSEVEKLLSVIEKEKIKVLFVDTYQVTQFYLEKLKSKVKVVYLDDLNKFIYPVDSLICYANYWEKFNYEIRYPDTHLYLGTKYVPLREEFSYIDKKDVKESIENILILSGGTDQYNILEKIVDRISPSFNVKAINVVCGIYNLNYERLSIKYKKYRNICIHKSIDNIVDYMKSCDLAISAGGTTLYELCACGTPTISYCIADNQLDNVHQFAEDGIIDYAGDVRTGHIDQKIYDLLIQYQAPEFREKKSIMMQSMIDGKGAQRIANIMIS